MRRRAPKTIRRLVEIGPEGEGLMWTGVLEAGSYRELSRIGMMRALNAGSSIEPAPRRKREQTPYNPVNGDDSRVG